MIDTRRARARIGGGGGWAVRRRQQAIGGQCLVYILSNVRKEKKMIGFFPIILCSHTCIHATKLYVACLLSYIFPPRASVCQDCIGVSINDVLIFLS